MSRPSLPGSASAHDSLVAACKTRLELAGWAVCRVNQVAMLTRRGWRTNGADIGAADLVASSPPSGHCVWIECKSGGSRPRIEQRAFAQRWRKSGATYLVARTVDDLQELLDGFSAAERALTG